jgi:hypothetical protein
MQHNNLHDVFATEKYSPALLMALHIVVDRLTQNQASVENATNPSKLLKFPPELYLDICGYLNQVEVVCLGIICKATYALHFGLHGIIPLDDRSTRHEPLDTPECGPFQSWMWDAGYTAVKSTWYGTDKKKGEEGRVYKFYRSETEDKINENWWEGLPSGRALELWKYEE